MKMKRKELTAPHAAKPSNGMAVMTDSALSAERLVRRGVKANGLKAIKARFASKHDEMLRKARQNCRELTGKDHV